MRRRKTAAPKDQPLPFFDISWLAVKGASPEAIFAAASLPTRCRSLGSKGWRPCVATTGI